MTQPTDPTFDAPFCSTHGNEFVEVDGVLTCPVCNHKSRRAKAICCTGVSGRICGRQATVIARHENWTVSATPFCTLHRPLKNWIVLATSKTGFDLDYNHQAGTPAFYGITIQEQKE